MNSIPWSLSFSLDSLLTSLLQIRVHNN